MSKKAYQRYTQEFKDKAVGLLSLGKLVAEVALKLEVCLQFAARATEQRDPSSSVPMPVMSFG